MPRSAVAIVGVLVVLALAGCTKQEPEFTANDQVPAEQRTAESEAGGEPAAPAPDAVFVVEGSELQFDQAPTTLPAGEVTIALDNRSGLPHDVTFEGGPGTVVEAAGQSTDTGTATLEAGTVTYFCSVPGHRQSGMEGTITVQ
jgi:plastocyanin